MNLATFWLILGFSGQGLFASRFLIQWISSERRGKSHIPKIFWYISIVGGLISLSYAIHLGDPPFIFGQSAGVLVYTRNLMLLRRKSAVTASSGGN
ncbi:MAG: lipid A biosynthesis protein [Acidobacteria bacterium]|nr:MAG: lipid A biosynthesis protein [Acidobacteriota bacterium]